MHSNNELQALGLIVDSHGDISGGLPVDDLSSCAAKRRLLLLLLIASRLHQNRDHLHSDRVVRFKLCGAKQGSRREVRLVAQLP